MAWIESHQHLDKNGKLLELANRLQINRYQAIGHLHALWWWALDNAEDGDISRFSSVTVTQACGWSDYMKDEECMSRINEVTNSDKADHFVPALIACGFLDKKDDGLWIHNWPYYTERYFKSVKLNKRLREQANKRVKAFRNRNASVTLLKRSVTVPTVPNLTVPNLTKEKERERETWFDIFWKTYPRKIGKSDALKYFKAQIQTEADWGNIQTALRNYQSDIQKHNTEPRFILHGSTFCHTRWLDYLEAQNASDGSESFSVQLAKRRAADEAEKLRKETSNGKVPAGL